MIDMKEALLGALNETPGLRDLINQKPHVALPNISAVWDSPKRWNAIRDYYASVLQEIMRGERIDVYASGLGNHMTPIERAIWNDIRVHGLPFYPQYPVGRRFVDFGDPVGRIAIEVDGAAYHTPDGDAQKDSELRADGWSVVRITGRDALRHENPLAELLPEYGLRPDGSLFRPRAEDEDGGET